LLPSILIINIIYNMGLKEFSSSLGFQSLKESALLLALGGMLPGTIQHCSEPDLTELTVEDCRALTERIDLEVDVETNTVLKRCQEVIGAESQ
jgi:hypothetical protein